MLLNLLGEWQQQRAPVEPLVVCSPRAGIRQPLRALGTACTTVELGPIDKRRGIVWNLAKRVGPTWRLLDRLRAFQPDVVCVNGAFSFLAAAPAARLLGMPVVWFEHNNRSLPRGRIVNWLVGQARQIVWVSRTMRDEFVAQVPEAAAKSMVIPNGVDPARFGERDGAAQVRREFGWAADAPAVGTVCRLAPEKGMDVFLEACHRVQEALPQARWLCVGDGPERAALERRAAGYSPPLQIVWAGWREDVPRLLAALDVFVLASRAEAFPLVVLEAMAAARPVVATDVGGVREAVVHGETGLLVPPEDPEALADAVLDLLGDVNKRRALGQAGRAWVKREFTLERQAREFLKVLFDSPFS